MNATILVRALETDSLRAALRPCKVSPRPIPCPEIRPNSRFGCER
jgi:hypothetical protein